MSGQTPSFAEAFRFWWKLGWISFGGPAGQIAIMHQFLVEKKQWISREKFLHALNFCMLLPGPEATQLATYMGWQMHGKLGGILAGIFFILPSMLVLGLLSTIYVLFGNVYWVQGLFDGLKPAVLAIVILALLKIGQKSLHHWSHYTIAVLAFVALSFLGVPFPIVVGVSLLAGFLLGTKDHNTVSGATPMNSMDYRKYFLASARVVAIALAMVLFPVGCVLLFIPGDAPFWQGLISFFTKAALVTFGGAYAVLPYVAQSAVEQQGWLSAPQMVDGLALGETTPGPLIMVLAFVGFMASFHHYDMVWWLGLPGLIAATYYTFLPSFVFILAGAPWVERSADYPRLKNALTLVTAAVVGVLLNLCFYLGMSILFAGTFSMSSLHWGYVAWMFLSLYILRTERIGMIPWIVLSAVAGLTAALFRHFVM